MGAKHSLSMLKASLLLASLWMTASLHGQPCNITGVAITNDQCLPGPSPVGFQINVFGTGTDFTISSPGGSIPDPGPYSYTFGAFINLTPSDPNQPIYNFIITDADDPSCTFTFTVSNPCVYGNCQIDEGLISFSCNSGDIVLFSLNATAQNSTTNFYNIYGPRFGKCSLR
jgi:hypothetical protein